MLSGHGACIESIKIYNFDQLYKIRPEIPFIFEESDLKKVQKLEKTIIVGDKTGDL